MKNAQDIKAKLMEYNNNNEHRANRLKKLCVYAYDTTVNTIPHTELHFAWY